MNLHEYQAKELLKRYNVPTQEGVAVEKVDDAVNAYKTDRSRQRYQVCRCKGADTCRRPR
jgi:succinyl-CoA synthetase beta subunit